MAQKLSKSDIRSGNTFRAFKSKFQRQYLRQSALIRRFQRKSKVNETVLDNLGIEDDVVYSLNKKGRWEFPELLQDAILDGKYDDLDHNVQLITYHNVKKRNNAIGYYASKGKTKKLESTNKSHFNRKTVIGEWRLFEQSEGCVEVVYPCESFSSIAHNMTKIGAYIEKPEKTDRKLSKSRKPKRQKLTTKEYYDEMNDINTIIDDCETEGEIEDELIEYQKSNSISVRNGCRTELLENILFKSPPTRVHNLAGKRNSTRKILSPKKREHKGRTYYIPPPSSAVRDTTTDGKEENTITNLTEKLSDFVHVLIPKTELEACNLSKYGDKYAESQCIPRKFIIDISDRVEKQFNTSEHLTKDKIYNTDFTSCVVFSHDPIDALNTSTHHVYKVYLNMATNEGYSRIATIQDYFVGCVDDILHRIDLFVQKSSTIEFNKKEKEPMKATSRRFGSLVQYSTNEDEIVYLTRSSMYKDIFRECKHDNVKNSSDYEIVLSSVCGICFDDVGDDKNSGTALASCGHLFCDECWSFYCRSHVKTDSRPISCPQYKCAEIVDETALLGFVNVIDVINFKRRIHEMELQSSGSAKWCPNSDCGCVIKVQNPEKTNDITCQCGMQFCFHCQLQHHWPASCQSSTSYLMELKYRGDDIFRFDLSEMPKTREVMPKVQKIHRKRWRMLLYGLFMRGRVLLGMFRTV